jgi:hypothetical protein
MEEWGAEESEKEAGLGITLTQESKKYCKHH